MTERFEAAICRTNMRKFFVYHHDRSVEADNQSQNVTSDIQQFAFADAGASLCRSSVDEAWKLVKDNGESCLRR